MAFNAKEILAVLDHCCEACTFPMLDNGYVYLAATRLSLFRSVTDWAMVIEVFGFSPAAGMPDTTVHTFASRLNNRATPDSFENRGAYEEYLAANPNNDSHAVFPVQAGLWQDAEHGEWVTEDAKEVIVRDQPIPLPSLDEYARHGIELEEAPRVQVFELCRYLADVARDQVLATPQERRISILPDMEQILHLDEWRHPNLIEEELPSDLETFQQLAKVLCTREPELYRASEKPNTHWRNWPEGGRL
jgi:hypothetical protein